MQFPINFDQIIITIFKKKELLPAGELNPGLPRDRRRSLPLYYQKCDGILLSFVRSYSLAPLIDKNLIKKYA